MVVATGASDIFSCLTFGDLCSKTILENDNSSIIKRQQRALDKSKRVLLMVPTRREREHSAGMAK
jgi:hypothetical protein